MTPQREIKFRAWDKTLKLMGNVDVLEWNKGRKNNGTDKNLIYIRANKPSQYEMQTGSDKHLDEYVLMQFTGLLDKNGIEIYEGDIVKKIDASHTDEKDIEQVIFQDGGFRIKCGQEEPLYTADIDYYNLEVIGNIYENKNLLI